MNNEKAPIAHHFHNHQWCNSTWCAFKNWDEKEMNKLLEQNKLQKLLKQMKNNLKLSATAFLIIQLKKKEFMKNAKAPIDHHIHNHQRCNSTWCAFKNWDEKEMNELLEQNKLQKLLKKTNEKQLTIKCDSIFNNSIEKNIYILESDNDFD